ncbi:MAG TPA: ABC transporter permease [Bacteroidales bacterium]|nr:ABC transporter permease [Bacteroidales bacterium]
MNKIFLIMQREFMTRVRKKSFIITTLLSPIFFAVIAILPTYLASLEVTDVRTIAVVDNSKQFTDVIPSTQYIKVVYIADTPAEQVKGMLDKAGYYALLVIDSAASAIQPAFTLYSQKQPAIDVMQHIENTLEKEIESRKLKSYNIDNLDNILADVKTNISIKSIKISQTGEEKESNTVITMAIAYIMSFMMYMMVLITGNQVMQGVVEEKTNRVVEVIVSSVKPFQMMVGKIFGMASVSLLQILIWVVMTAALAGVGINIIGGNLSSKPNADQVQALAQTDPQLAQVQEQATAFDNGEGLSFLNALKNQNFPLLIGGFIFYFLFGYLLYAAMFAAVGSAVESVTDTQQLTLPITLPLILAIIVMISGIKSPDGPLAFWFSMIPFTSPIIMLTRLPFGVPAWQLALSAILLVGTFILTTWLAAKIYRVGILMYGKKYTWKEMIKWISYKG